MSLGKVQGFYSPRVKLELFVLVLVEQSLAQRQGRKEKGRAVGGRLGFFQPSGLEEWRSLCVDIFFIPRMLVLSCPQPIAPLPSGGHQDQERSLRRVLCGSSGRACV